MALGTQFRRRRTHSSGAPPVRSVTENAVVELPEGAGSGSPPRPEPADILKAVHELGRKLSVVTKNQKALERKLGAIEKQVNNNGYNVVNGMVYLDHVMWTVGWWADNGNTDQAEQTWPKTPHWY